MVESHDSSLRRRQQRQQSIRKIIEAFLANKYQGKHGEKSKFIGRAKYKELKAITKLSHSVLSQRLDDLRREGLIRKVSSVVEGDYYEITTKSIKDVLVHAYMFAEQSTILFQNDTRYKNIDDLLADFSRKLGALGMYVIIKALALGQTVNIENDFLAISPAKEWLTNAVDFWQFAFLLRDVLKSQVRLIETKDVWLDTEMSLSTFNLKDSSHFYKVMTNTFERLYPTESEVIKQIEQTVVEIAKK